MKLARTILVVEDSEDEAQILRSGLSGGTPQHAVVVKTSTTEAENYVFAESVLAGGTEPNPDLVVVDVRVPPRGGADFLSRLRSDRRTRMIPVLMVSGGLQDGEVQDLYRQGANSFIDKPVDGRDLAELMGRAANYWLGLNLSARTPR